MRKPPKRKKPEKPKVETPKAERGRPSSYRPEFAVQAEKLCKLGATDPELADFFEVSVTTVRNWMRVHPDFLAALKGKDEADDRVERSLYQKAIGYEHDAVKIFQVNGEPLIVPYRERVAPDTTAAIFWLKNRRPEQWRDVNKHEHTQIAETNLTDEQLADIARSGSRRTAPKANGTNGTGGLH